MEPGTPQWPPQPQGRPSAQSQGPDRGLWTDGYHRPAPHPWHSGQRFRQWQDVRRSPQPQKDPRADRQQPRYMPRPASGGDYYEGGHPRQLHSRYGVRARSGPSSPRSLWTHCSFPSSFSFSFASSPPTPFPSPPYYIDGVKHFSPPHWILVTENSISFFCIP